MNKFIIILCNTNSLQVFNLCVSELKQYYGEDNVGEEVVALEWDLDMVTDVLTKRFNREKKKIYVLRDEGFISDDQEFIKPFTDLLIKKGCKSVIILDTFNHENNYTGYALKDHILDEIFNITQLINSSI